MARCLMACSLPVHKPSNTGTQLNVLPVVCAPPLIHSFHKVAALSTSHAAARIRLPLSPASFVGTALYMYCCTYCLPALSLPHVYILPVWSTYCLHVLHTDRAAGRRDAVGSDGVRRGPDLLVLNPRGHCIFHLRTPVAPADVTDKVQ